MREIFPGFVQKDKVTKEFLYSKQSLSPSVSTEGLFFCCREGGKIVIAEKAGRLLLPRRRDVLLLPGRREDCYSRGSGKRLRLFVYFETKVFLAQVAECDDDDGCYYLANKCMPKQQLNK